jgi:4-amino-4-deoxy-L-arabinose transferase-like glycosyltransferase
MLAINIRNHSQLRTILIAGLITIVAVLLRIAYLTHTEVKMPYRGDACYYCIYADNLLHRGVFSKEVSQNPTPDSFWSPGYPALLASILHFAGAKRFYRADLITQALLGAFTAGMAFVVGSLFLPVWAAAAAGVLTACSPHLISMNGYLLTETLFAFTLTLFLLLFLIAIKTGHGVIFCAAGAVAGAGYLVNPVIYFAPLLFAGLFFMAKEWRHSPGGGRKNKTIWLFLVAFMVPWLLWSVRGRLNVPASSASSANRALDNFIIGAHHDFFDIWRANPRDPANPAKLDEQKVKGSWSKFIAILAGRILDDPGHYAKWYFYEKPKILWSWDILIGQGDVYVYEVTTSWFQNSGLAGAIHSVMKSIHWWLFLLCFLGAIFIITDLRRNPGGMVTFVYLLMIYVSAVYVVLQAEPRYSIPLRPFMYLGAMFGLCRISSLIRKFLVEKRPNGLPRTTQ